MPKQTSRLVRPPPCTWLSQVPKRDIPRVHGAELGNCCVIAYVHIRGRTRTFRWLEVNLACSSKNHYYLYMGQPAPPWQKPSPLYKGTRTPAGDRPATNHIWIETVGQRNEDSIAASLPFTSPGKDWMYACRATNERWTGSSPQITGDYPAGQWGPPEEMHSSSLYVHFKYQMHNQYTPSDRRVSGPQETWKKAKLMCQKTHQKKEGHTS